MTVIQELDKTLFDGYVQPKSSVVMSIVRDGILDSDMDWYETPQPTGAFPNPIVSRVDTKQVHRNQAIHVRGPDVFGWGSRPSQRRS
jgi:hypothetical protein